MLQWIRHCLQVSLRQMEIPGSGLQIHMTEQDLNGAQVCSRLEQVGRPAVAQGVRRYMLLDTRIAGGLLHAYQTVLSEMGLSGPRWPVPLGKR